MRNRIQRIPRRALAFGSFTPVPRGAEAPVGDQERPHYRVLVISDDRTIDEEFVQGLALGGDLIEWVRSGERGLDELRGGGYDVAVVSATLPGMSGLQCCRLAVSGSDTPVVFLGDSDNTDQFLTAFDLGAVDCVRRPVGADELWRRFRAITSRRSTRHLRDIAGPAGIEMNLRAHELRVNGQVLDVTPREFDLLRLLIERRGEVLTADEISLEVWGFGTFGSRNFVEAHISRLRMKLRSLDVDNVIKTIRGVGYVVR